MLLSSIKPALQQILAAFPFKIQGFHADNGSETINYTVAELLETLSIEFTKSRPRHSNDNGLVESKNGSVVRKRLEAQEGEASKKFQGRPTLS